MGHDHDHGSGHAHGVKNYGNAFRVGISLNLALVAVQLVFGLRAHSLALVADAGHNFSDVLGLVLAWWVSVLATRRPTERRTYGLRSSSILGALGNAVFLLVAIGGLTWEAVQRLRDPHPVHAPIIMWVAGIGIAINAVSAAMFMSGRKQDLNIRAAFMHLAADAAVGVGVLLAGGVILFTGWLWVDPVTSLLVNLVVVLGTWSLLRDSMNLALHAVPPAVDPAAVRSYLAGLPGVIEVHDLHIWGMSTTETALTAHLVGREPIGGDPLLARIAEELHTDFAIDHSTLQFETGGLSGCCNLHQEVPARSHPHEHAGHEH